jgi:predicted RNA-binding Zn ribbon-like protein
VFFDESRGGQRRWCDMATCGNQAKAARHRARAKAGKTGAKTQPSETARAN